MPNDWSGLSLGGVGNVNVRGATPPVGNTGPGGATGMGLMALLRRLSMGLDDRETELPKPMSPDPASERSMAQMLGLDTGEPLGMGAGGGSEAESQGGYDWGRGAMNAADAASDWRSSPLEVLTAGLSGGRMGPTEKDMEATGQPMQPVMGTQGGIGPTQADMAATGQPMQPLPQGPPVPMSKPMPPMSGSAGMADGMPPPTGMPPGGMGAGGMGEMTPEMMRQIYEQEMARLNGTGAGY